MINLIIPMAGRGSRFSKAGYQIPKPLVELNGRPFLWWSIMSIKRVVDIKTLNCVILKEHIEEFDIKNRVLEYFPEAQFTVLDDVSDGALDSAVIGLSNIANNYPILINDCDHAFEANELPKSIKKLVDSDDIDGFLCHFKSSSPAYSYAKYSNDGSLEKTVEKQVISELAIAGAYIFKDKALIEKYFTEYKQNCEYSETYISGLYNFMIRDSKKVEGIMLNSHLSFGTPEELSVATESMPYHNWL